MESDERTALMMKALRGSNINDDAFSSQQDMNSQVQKFGFTVCAETAPASGSSSAAAAALSGAQAGLELGVENSHFIASAFVKTKKHGGTNATFSVKPCIYKRR